MVLVLYGNYIFMSILHLLIVQTQWPKNIRKKVQFWEVVVFRVFQTYISLPEEKITKKNPFDF